MHTENKINKCGMADSLQGEQTIKTIKAVEVSNQFLEGAPPHSLVPGSPCPYKEDITSTIAINVS